MSEAVETEKKSGNTAENSGAVKSSGKTVRKDWNTAKDAVFQPTETVVYIGPGIPGVIAEGTILNNGLPRELKEKQTEIPAVGALIVPIAKLAAARRELDRKDSPVSICYAKVLQSVKKGE